MITRFLSIKSHKQGKVFFENTSVRLHESLLI